MTPIARRIAPPVATLAAVMLASGLAYHHAHRLPSHVLHQTFATVSVVVYFATIALGALYVYARAYRRGASVGERIVAASITPLLWMTKEVCRVGPFYPLADTLFFFLNPLHLTLLCAVTSGRESPSSRAAMAAGGVVRRSVSSVSSPSRPSSCRWPWRFQPSSVPRTRPHPSSCS